MGQRVLVTGSSGVLGYALHGILGEYPEREFVFSTRADCDLRDFRATAEYVRQVKPDAILHLAAVTGGVVLSRRHPAALLRDNVLVTLSVLEAARELPIRKLVMALSSGMYPPDAPLPIKEEYIHLGPAHESNYSYAYAKRLIEPAVRAYRQEFDLSVIGLVPNGIFGENDKFAYDVATMPAALMRRFCEAGNSGEPIVVWGDGSPLRELTYSQDMARAFMWALDHYDEPNILNVGTSEEVSVKDVALAIAECLGLDQRRIVFDTSKPGGVFRKTSDTSKFRALSKLGFTPFRVGLKRTLDWLQEHLEEIAAKEKRAAPAEGRSG